MREVVVFRHTTNVYVVDRNRRKKQINGFSFLVVVERWKMLFLMADALRFPSTNSRKQCNSLFTNMII